MSSSNPFRRLQPTDRIESSPASVASEASQVANLDFSSIPSSTSKELGSSPPPRPSSSPPPRPSESLPPSPHPSLPVLTQQPDYAKFTTDGLSSASTQVVTGAADPFHATLPASSGDEGLSTDTERMSQSVDSKRVAPGMPPKPFTRTVLATIEEPWRSSSPQELVHKEGESSQQDRKMPRASMDVNAFKNLLMTGKATADVPPRTKASSMTLPDNSSSTDTSSTSRHSLSEPPYEAGSETPRTSYEQSISETGDENSQLLQGSQKHDRAKPVPPKHRHGKAFAPQGPQMVSFADFNTSFSTSSPSSVPIVLSSVSPTSPTSPTTTDLNKPLPLPPRPSSRDSASMDMEVPSPKRWLETNEGPETVSPKRIPPTIPLARRASRHGSLPVVRTRSNTQTSNASAKDESETRSISESINSNKAPPPPPKRRSNVIAIPQNYTPDEDAGSSSLSRTSSLRSPPPMPAARNRSLSQLSSPSSTSVSSGITSPPPPPPPRRSFHRQSSKSSTEMCSPPESRRVSQEMGRPSFDSEDRRGSMGSILKEQSVTEEAGKSEAEAGTRAPPRLLQEATQVESQQTNDILADMEAFQREIDELKKKFE